MRISDITVFDHYKRYLPLIDEPTYDNLKKQIQDEGILTPLVVWNTDSKNILLDGHNRYRIAKEISLKDVPVVTKTFATDEDAEYWIICNQLNRRNLTERELKYFIGAKYNHEKQAAHAGVNQHTKEVTANFTTTSDKIAKQYGISEKAVRDYAKDAEVIEALPEPTRKNFLSGGDAITTKEIRTLAKAQKKDSKTLDKISKQKDTPQVREVLKRVAPKVQSTKVTDNVSNLNAEPDVYLDLYLSRLHAAVRKYIKENGVSRKQELINAIEHKLKEIKEEKY